MERWQQKQTDHIFQPQTNVMYILCISDVRDICMNRTCSKGISCHVKTLIIRAYISFCDRIQIHVWEIGARANTKIFQTVSQPLLLSVFSFCILSDELTTRNSELFFLFVFTEITFTITNVIAVISFNFYSFSMRFEYKDTYKTETGCSSLLIILSLVIISGQKWVCKIISDARKTWTTKNDITPFWND